jgi:DivIVA domain-containing protein
VDGTWVRTVEFRQAVGGYDRDHVDEVLDKVATAIDAGWSPKPIIRDVHFRHTWWKGYHRQDVDQFIELLRTSTDLVLAEPSIPQRRSATPDTTVRDASGLLAGRRREQKRRERAEEKRRRDEQLATLMEFPSLPGTHIRCRRTADSKNTYEFYRVGTATPLAIVHNRSKTDWNPTKVVIASTPYVVKHQRKGRTESTSRTEVIDSRTDRPALVATGRHFDHSHSTKVFLSEDRVLTFPVDGETPYLSEMTAIDGESKTWIRFRRKIDREKARNDVEKMLILVEPDVTLSTELLLTIALVAGSLKTYFMEPRSAV